MVKTSIHKFLVLIKATNGSLFGRLCLECTELLNTKGGIELAICVVVNVKDERYVFNHFFGLLVARGLGRFHIDLRSGVETFINFTHGDTNCCEVDELV
jgi:hypothetical protein